VGSYISTNWVRRLGIDFLMVWEVSPENVALAIERWKKIIREI